MWSHDSAPRTAHHRPNTPRPTRHTPHSTLKWTGGLLMAPKSLHRRNRNQAKQGYEEYIDQTCASQKYLGSADRAGGLPRTTTTRPPVVPC